MEAYRDGEDPPPEVARLAMEPARSWEAGPLRDRLAALHARYRRPGVGWQEADSQDLIAAARTERAQRAFYAEVDALRGPLDRIEEYWVTYPARVWVTFPPHFIVVGSPEATRGDEGYRAMIRAAVPELLAARSATPGREGW